MLTHFATRGRTAKLWPWPLLLDGIAILVGLVMTCFVAGVRADLYVSSPNSDSVPRYNEITGDLIDVFIGSGSGGLSSPRGLLLGPDGNLYVSSYNTNSVMRYDGKTGAPLPAPGKPDAVFVTPGDGELQGPVGLIFGRDGNLYVISRSNDQVLRYSGATGDFLDAFVPAGFGGLYYPRGLVFGPDGNLYVNSGFDSVLRYDGSTGAFLGRFASRGGMGLGPGLVFGSDGKLYVGTTSASSSDNSVVRFDGATGEFLDTFVSPGSGGLDFPSGLIFGPDNNLYVSSNHSDSVLRFDGITGAFMDTFIPAGNGLHLPSYLFFTNSDPTTLAYVPPPKSRFLITAPATAVSGTPFDITVTALDSSGNIDTSYQGTVTFSTTDTDSGVVLPADYTFTAGDGGDNGVHTFPSGVTLITVGDQTLTATDTVSGITRSIIITVGPGP